MTASPSAESKKSHGGKRPTAGRPAISIDERRMMVLISQGVSRVEIARRFGVGKHVITDRVIKLKKIAGKGLS